MRDVGIDPGKAAIVMGGDGSIVTHGDLDARANRGARLLRSLDMRPGDALALCIDNSPAFLEIACAGRRCGLLIVPISTRLTASELGFIVADSGARVLVLSPEIEASATAAVAACPNVRIFSVLASDAIDSWEDAAAAFDDAPIEDAQVGGEMLYSSGTTGRPKGVIHHNSALGAADGVSTIIGLFDRLGIDGGSTYLSPAPLYHSAPFVWALGMLAIGGTVVVMERFDPEAALALIERHRIDLAQWVPTHFVRMLKLPPAVRDRFDVSSLRLAAHAAAPCPVPVKQAMIAWWGPILLEYFGSTEQGVLTVIDSDDWLRHPGSVGRCVQGAVHVCADDGAPLPAGEVGLVYSEGGMAFSYRGDPAKTSGARNAAGWTTVGDIGRLDGEGYLYLTDRRSFTIISGGVNIYPQEIEDLLITHPSVADAAVLGAPDDDLGEIVVAVIQPLDPANETPEFALLLRGWLRQSLSGVKVPKRILFRRELPRLPTGKMAKHRLRDEVAAELRLAENAPAGG